MRPTPRKGEWSVHQRQALPESRSYLRAVGPQDYRQLRGSCDFGELIGSALPENKCVQALVVLRPTLVAERSGDPARTDG